MTDAPGSEAHGGVAGWFRVASGFAALATLELGGGAWVVLRRADLSAPMSPRALAALLALCSVLAGTAAFLAARRHASAGALLLASSVVTFAIGRGVSLPLLIALLALVGATARRVHHAKPAA
jgi:hypothetical protein